MSKCNVEFHLKPNATDIAFLSEKINEETAEYGHASTFGFFIRDGSGQIIAGANGVIIYGTIYTDNLWVDKKYRNNGFARKIINQIHEFGKQKGCTMATLQTMSFQGVTDFYEKLGYQPDFKRNGYVQTSQCIFMIKEL